MIKAVAGLVIEQLLSSFRAWACGQVAVGIVGEKCRMGVGWRPCTVESTC